MKLQIGDHLCTVHNAQLVYSYHVLSVTSLDDIILAGSKIRKRDRDHQNINIVAVPILCNAYVQINYAGMYVQ